MHIDSANPLVVWSAQGRLATGELIERLDALGYGAALVLSAADPGPAEDHANCTIVALLPARGGLSAAANEWLAALPESALVLGLAPAIGSQSRELTGLFDDLAPWPCSGAELATRLNSMWREPLDVGIDGELYLQQTLLGDSRVFREAVALLRKYSQTDAPVLIEGETGTGKELAAAAVHALGGRASRPFVAVNCGAVPENMIESEFFGHVKGAFTDAKSHHDGYVAQAHGGTLFFDEVEALSPRAQVALLRFLQSSEYRSVGAEKVVTADVRTIAASNLPLEELVAAGRFRRDLFYRLNVLRVELPPLRERGGDLLLLAESFARRFAARYGKRCSAFAVASQRQLRRYCWPGNARELENAVHRAVVIAEADDALLHLDPTLEHPPGIGGDQLTDETLLALPLQEAKALVVGEFERRYLTECLAESQGNISKAAQRAGKHRRAFDKLIEKHGIDKATYRNRR